MEVRKSYCINQNTIAITPFFSEHGELFSRVLEGNNIFIVQQKPLLIIQESLLQFGGEYKGAVKAAKYHLGERYMVPIKISGLHHIYFLSDQSPKNHYCIWIALHHIEGFEKESLQRTRVYLSCGHVIIVSMRKKQFCDKLNLARQYKAMVEEPFYSLFKQLDGYMIIKELDELNYTIKKKE
ncbi:competence protein ComK [Bacillus massiliigorillae]|uniref:competence protein ComK n=1 Tax=Bacillus massiliigorillae TaxID=1243664 RepID=UPI0003A9E273|nr:competence protein ComK [Bacillus massiliigorillae]